MYKKVTPTHYAKSIKDIDYEQLHKQGVTTLFFDLDNTLIPYDIYVIDNEYQDFLEKLNEKFKVAIVSNSRKSRVTRATKNLTNIPFLWFAKKPTKFGFKKALKMVNSKSSETAAIGDQMMTDVFGANRLKFKASILVYPIKKRSDHFFTRLNRRVETFFIKKIKRKTPEQYEKVLKEYVETK